MNSYRALDPITEGPQVMGPSRDWNSIAKRETVYRQEWGYNVRPGRVPVALQMPMARPQTTTPVLGGLKPGRVPVLIRQSNIDPMASGQGVGHWKYSVSDPYWAHTAPGRAAMAGLGSAPLDTSGGMITDVTIPDGTNLSPGVPAPIAPAALTSKQKAEKWAAIAGVGALIGLAAWVALRKA